MIVMKFGGTSIGNADRIRTVAGIVKAELRRNPIIIVSAFSGVTDMLIDTARRAVHNGLDIAPIKQRHFAVMDELGVDQSVIWPELEELELILRGIVHLKELTPRTLDLVMSFGERMAAQIIADYMKQAGLAARAYCAYDLGLVTDGHFGNADALPESEGAIRSRFHTMAPGVPVITGFIGKNEQGEITTLGRGGSDFTAALFGAALDVEEIQVWTDVDGILTADPKLVPSARSIEYVSYSEAAELAFLGAKVLHPKTILPAVRKRIPVKIRNTYNPEHRGTTVLADATHSHPVTSIACKSGVTVVNVYSPKMFLTHGFLATVFNVFKEHEVPIDMISTSEVNISMTIDSAYPAHELEHALSPLADIAVRNSRASISLVGTGIHSTPGIAGTVFSALGGAGINVEMISLGASKINLSFVVKEDEAPAAVQLLHDAFFGGSP